MDDIEGAIDAAVAAQVGEVTVTFESEQDDPSGLMKTWELGEHRAELRFLRGPDTGDPFNAPWHVKVIGPDPLTGGRVDSVWSRSYEERDAAEGAAVGKLRDKHRDLQRRDDAAVSPQDVGPEPAEWEDIDASDAADVLRQGDRVRVRADFRAAEHLGDDILLGTVLDTTGTGKVSIHFDGPDKGVIWDADRNVLIGEHDIQGEGSDLGEVKWIERAVGMGAEHAQVSPDDSVMSVASQVEDVSGVRVPRAEAASERHDDQDFIDATFTRAPTASTAFEILNDAGFRPVALAGTWSERRVVIQWYR